MESSEVFAVLAESIRREILHSVRDHELSVSQIVEIVGASQPTVSKHLRVLREAGLVASRAVGQRRLYRCEKTALQPVTIWLAGMGVLPTQPSAAVENQPGESADLLDGDAAQSQISRSMNRAATRAADLLANLPKFGRRRDH